MNSIEILASGKYLPSAKIENDVLNKKFNLPEEWIETRCGIKTRYYTKEDITQMAIKAVENLQTKIDMKRIGVIVVTSTSTDKLMPGISFEIQKYLQIPNCICLDVLAGCSGYINAFDIARKYLCLDNIDYGLVIGVERLSTLTKENDINTAILLGDGAAATLIGKTSTPKKYSCNIESDGQNGGILTCSIKEKIYMDGKKIYKFGTTKPVENVKKLLRQSNEKIDNIKYIIPHQSNIKMLQSMCNKLEIPISKMYINLDKVGNTFCASIPLALHEMMENKLLQKQDKIILLGYGGGLNLGSILLEI